MTDPEALIQAHRQVDDIQVGDHVQWEHRAPRDWEGVLLQGKVLSGRVRELRRIPTFGGDMYAVVETAPDGRLTMPPVSKLTRTAQS